jgi:7,8-dihydro-6-hydroxymethylpterin-pyrophosphokinase
MVVTTARKKRLIGSNLKAKKQRTAAIIAALAAASLIQHRCSTYYDMDKPVGFDLTQFGW